MQKEETFKFNFKTYEEYRKELEECCNSENSNFTLKELNKLVSKLLENAPMEVKERIPVMDLETFKLVMEEGHFDVIQMSYLIELGKVKNFLPKGEDYDKTSSNN